MHIHTIVKVYAKDLDEAIEKVNDELTNYGEYNNLHPFDYVSEEETKLSDTCKTEADFEALRADELVQYKHHLDRAEEYSKKEDVESEGYCLTLAGECLQSNKFWSTERQAYTLDWDEHKEGGLVFYIDTDRHA